MFDAVDRQFANGACIGILGKVRIVFRNNLGQFYSVNTAGRGNDVDELSGVIFNRRLAGIECSRNISIADAHIPWLRCQKFASRQPQRPLGNAALDRAVDIEVARGDRYRTICRDALACLAIIGRIGP